MEETNIYPHPEELLDQDGYPTEDALNYIKNWHLNGQWFGQGKYRELIDYVKSIYTYDDAIEEKDGLLEIHTFGWSGNEEIIWELKQTDLWILKFRAQQTGGHYYFRMDQDSDKDWQVQKVDSSY